MKALTKIICLSAIALMLGACGKKSSSGTSATTPTTTNCVYNNTYGDYRIVGTNTVCTPDNSQTGQCVWNATTNQFTIIGTNTVCNGGQSGNYQCTLTNNGYRDMYGNICTPNGYNGTGGGCSVYNNRPEWGYAHYVPMYVNGRPMCVRYDLVQSGYYNTYQDQYYYNGRPGAGCYYGDRYCNNGYSNRGSTCISIGGSNSGYNYGINGQLGFCF